MGSAGSCSLGFSMGFGRGRNGAARGARRKRGMRRARLVKIGSVLLHLTLSRAGASSGGETLEGRGGNRVRGWRAGGWFARGPGLRRWRRRGRWVRRGGARRRWRPRPRGPASRGSRRPDRAPQIRTEGRHLRGYPRGRPRRNARPRTTRGSRRTRTPASSNAWREASFARVREPWRARLGVWFHFLIPAPALKMAQRANRQKASLARCYGR